MSHNYEAMAAEIDRRLNDPSRPPMDLRTEPYSAAELRATVARFRTLPTDTQDRLLDILRMSIAWRSLSARGRLSASISQLTWCGSSPRRNTRAPLVERPGAL